MPKLHKVAEISKKIIIGFSIGVGSIVFLFVLLRIFGNIKDALFPSPPPPPTIRYGKLPQLPFPDSVTDKQLTFSLNTVSGSLPSLPSQVGVYRISQPQPNLLSFDNIKALAAKNSFTSDPIAISDSNYRWQNNDPLSSILTFNILTGDFSLTSSYLTNQDILSAANLPNPTDAITQAKDFLNGFQSFPSDIDESKTTFSLLSIINGQTIPATSFSNAQLIVINFFQKDVNNIPIYYPNYPASLINVTIGSSSTQTPQMAGVSYSHKIALTDDSSTYPIKSSAQALDELKNNKAYIANAGSGSSNVNINNVSLGYFIGPKPQLFLYPIIIFQGDNNFYAFVSAVKDEWIKN